MTKPDWSDHPAVARGVPALAIAGVWPSVLCIVAVSVVLLVCPRMLGLPPLSGLNPAAAILAGVLLARGYAKASTRRPHSFGRAFALASSSLFIVLLVLDRTQLLALSPDLSLRLWPDQLALATLEALLAVLYAAPWAWCITARARRLESAARREGSGAAAV
jgi:hypothetical protein